MLSLPSPSAAASNHHHHTTILRSIFCCYPHCYHHRDLCHKLGSIAIIVPTRNTIRASQLTIFLNHFQSNNQKFVNNSFFWKMFSSVCRKEREKKEKKNRCYTSIIECIKKERALTTLHDQTTAMPLSFFFLDVYLLPFYTVFFFHPPFYYGKIHESCS